MFVIIGTTTADLLVRHEAASSLPSADGFRASNLVFTTTSPLVLLGGNGAISAYVSAGLSIPTALVSSIGNDLFGHTLSQWLVERDVNTSGVIARDTHATSMSVILSSGAASQVVYHHRGASTEIDPADISHDLLARASVLLVSSYSLIPKLRSGGLAGLLARVNEAGGVTSLDIGPAIGEPVTLDEITPLLPHTHYLLANIHEMHVLTGETDRESAAAKALDAGARSLVIKRGPDGASMRGAGGSVDVPGFAVAATISVGAGDAFNSGFLAGVHRGLTAEQALRFGNAVAALVVSGARGALDAPTLDRVEGFLVAK